ncbi:aconitase X swivel domain-containing protein [Hypericibacter sp.]|uniref:aconitase X swivel domain-containing protein n=1 Tax=Hypericibacter sp. TaxID=2705401 RepID=UPI003D6CFC75
MTTVLDSKIQVEGEARGRVLKLDKPISFWGGVDPVTGRISDPRHPNHRAELKGRVLVLPGMIGSSSSSYIMLELMAKRLAPAALVVAEPDAILGLGVVVAREMNYGSIPVLVVPRDQQAALADGAEVTIGRDGRIRLA